MTPLEIEEYARNRYNAVGDNFWSTDEIMDVIYDGCHILAREALVIEKIFSTTSVEDQEEYDEPENLIAIKYLEYDGDRLNPKGIKEYRDIISSTSGAITGRPTIYAQFAGRIFIGPKPASDGDAIKIYGYTEPQRITSSSTIEVPIRLHTSLGNYVVGTMYEKDQNTAMAERYFSRWDKDVQAEIRWRARKKRTDRFTTVKDVDWMDGRKL